MKIINKLGVVFILLVSVFVIVYVLFPHLGLFGECKRAELGQSISPGSEYKTASYSLDCGATTEAATHIEISPLTQGKPKDIFVAKGNSSVNVVWNSPYELNLEYSGSTSDIFKIENSFGKVIIKVINESNP